MEHTQLHEGPVRLTSPTPPFKILLILPNTGKNLYLAPSSPVSEKQVEEQREGAFVYYIPVVLGFVRNYS